MYLIADESSGLTSYKGTNIVIPRVMQNFKGRKEKEGFKVKTQETVQAELFFL